MCVWPCSVVCIYNVVCRQWQGRVQLRGPAVIQLMHSAGYTIPPTACSRFASKFLDYLHYIYNMFNNIFLWQLYHMVISRYEYLDTTFDHTLLQAGMLYFIWFLYLCGRMVAVLLPPRCLPTAVGLSYGHEGVHTLLGKPSSGGRLHHPACESVFN